MKKMLTAIEVENYGEEWRKEAGITKEVETAVVQSIMNTSRFNRKGGKIFMEINPLYIHIPDWQRELDTTKSNVIANDCIEEKWDEPKVFWNIRKQQLEAADGSHRIFGAQIGKRESVLVYLMEVDEETAIRYFIEQGTDRRRMNPADFYIPGLRLKDTGCLNIREICHKRNIKVTKYDTEVKTSIGTLHGFREFSKLAADNPSLLENILDTIIAMKWIGSAKDALLVDNLRAIQKILCENSNDMEGIKKLLVQKCSGAKYYRDNVSVFKTQSQVYDWLVKEIGIAKEEQKKITNINIA